LKKVLILDDDPIFREVLESYVESEFKDFEVAAVPGVSGFIMEFNKKVPDVIFLDIFLPGISGYEIFKFLKLNDCQSKIYLMSGYAEIENNLLFVPDGYLQKPFDLDMVGDIIRNA